MVNKYSNMLLVNQDFFNFEDGDKLASNGE